MWCCPFVGWNEWCVGDDDTTCRDGCLETDLTSVVRDTSLVPRLMSNSGTRSDRKTTPKKKFSKHRAHSSHGRFVCSQRRFQFPEAW